MSESSEYLRRRAERKERAGRTMEANAKAAKEAKAKAQGKLDEKRGEQFARALSEKQARRQAEWRRSTTLPVEETTAEEQPVETTQVVPASGDTAPVTPAPSTPATVKAPASAKAKSKE